MTEKMKKEVRDDSTTLQRLRHSLICPVVLHYDNRNQDPHGDYFIVSEYGVGGTMASHLSQIATSEVSEKELLRWATSIALGLFYAHSRSRMHRNISSHHLFFDEHCNTLKLGNFANIPYSMYEEKYYSRYAQGFYGEHYYLSPRVAKGEQAYEALHDVHALGVLIREISTLDQPPQGAPHKYISPPALTTEQIEAREHHLVGSNLSGVVHNLLDALI